MPYIVKLSNSINKANNSMKKNAKTNNLFKIFIHLNLLNNFS